MYLGAVQHNTKSLPISTSRGKIVTLKQGASDYPG